MLVFKTIAVRLYGNGVFKVKINCWKRKEIEMVDNSEI